MSLLRKCGDITYMCRYCIIRWGGIRITAAAGMKLYAGALLTCYADVRLRLCVAMLQHMLGYCTYACAFGATLQYKLAAYTCARILHVVYICELRRIAAILANITYYV